MKEENKKHKNFLFYDFVKVTGIFPAWLYLLPRIHYPMSKPSVKGSTLVICNHSSFWDPVILLCTFWTRRPSFVATTELFSSKIGRWFFEHVHCIEIDKEDVSISTFHKVRKELRSGAMVCIFPEGRVHDGIDTIDPFKGGAVMMSVQGKSDIIPVYVKHRDHWPQRTEVFIGERIRVDSQTDIPSIEKIKDISEKLYRIESDLKEICDKGRK